MTTVLAIDVGKTRCRAGAWTNGGYLGRGVAAGAPGLAEADGLLTTERSISAAIQEALDHAQGDPRGDRAPVLVGAIGVGAAGAEAAPDVAASLAHNLTERLGAPTAVATDSLTAHAGAFEGDPGTVLVTGTGAVAVSLDADGELRQIDGWGPWLGDEGSGQWIGRMGLIAALRAHDGRGPATSLLTEAIDLAGSPIEMPGWVSGGGMPARRLGEFAPYVLRAVGDEVADAIVRDAVARLVETCSAAGNADVCLYGGVTDDPRFRSLLTTALSERGLRLKDPLGDALAGATFIAQRRDTPYEGRIIRA